MPDFEEKSLFQSINQVVDEEKSLGGVPLVERDGGGNFPPRFAKRHR
jgi:hypothetical protein